MVDWWGFEGNGGRREERKATEVNRELESEAGERIEKLEAERGEKRERG